MGTNILFDGMYFDLTDAIAVYKSCPDEAITLEALSERERPVYRATITYKSIGSMSSSIDSVSIGFISAEKRSEFIQACVEAIQQAQTALAIKIQAEQEEYRNRRPSSNLARGGMPNDLIID